MTDTGGGGGDSQRVQDRSVTLVRVLGVYDFDVGEREETPPSVHLALPLAADVHPGDLDDVPDLRRDGQEAEFRHKQEKKNDLKYSMVRLRTRFVSEMSLHRWVVSLTSVSGGP